MRIAPTTQDPDVRFAHLGPIMSRYDDDRRGGGPDRQRDRDEAAKIFVGGLPDSLNVDGLRREFEKFGRIVDCFTPGDRDTGKHKGFGFVTFEDVRDAEDAMREMDGKEIDGRTLRVNKPQPRRGEGGGGGGGGALRRRRRRRVPRRRRRRRRPRLRPRRG